MIGISESQHMRSYYYLRAVTLCLYLTVSVTFRYFLVYDLVWYLLVFLGGARFLIIWYDMELKHAVVIVAMIVSRSW